MAWFRVDDGFWRHRKVRRLGRAKVSVPMQVAGAGLWLLSGSWASDTANTDEGFIPREQVQTWDPKLQLAARLVEVGLWRQTEHQGEVGYCYHDWTEYNPTSQEVADIRAKRAEAGRKGGVRSGQSRREASEANREANASASGRAKGKPKRTPSPYPSASNEADQSPTGATAQTIISEYIDRCSKTPPRNVLSQLGKHIKAMLEEGIDSDDVRRGLATWMTKQIAPSLLPSVVNQVMNRQASAPNGTSANRTDANIASILRPNGSQPNLLALEGGAS